MVKSGLVLNIEKNKAYIMTSEGEFTKLKIKGNVPAVGETYSGDVYRELSFYRYPLIAASLACMIMFGSTAYAYYTPTSSVVVEINPSIRLSVNRWGKIIGTTPLNKDGEKILSEIKLNNKTLDDGLKSIVDESKKDNFINDDYIKNNNVISVFIDNKKSSDVNISGFKEYISDNDLELRVNSNGKEIFHNETKNSKKTINPSSGSNENNGDNKNKGTDNGDINTKETNNKSKGNNTSTGKSKSVQENNKDGNGKQPDNKYVPPLDRHDEKSHPNDEHSNNSSNRYTDNNNSQNDDNHNDNSNKNRNDEKDKSNNKDKKH